MFLSKNGILRVFASIFFHGTKFRAIFSSAERFGMEFREFSVPRNGSERNSESLLLFLFHGTEFRAFLSSAEQFGMESREFSVPRNSQNFVGTNQLSVYSDFRRIIFLSEIPNPSYEELDFLSGWPGGFSSIIMSFIEVLGGNIFQSIEE
jgi:hypothetical protein